MVGAAVGWCSPIGQAPSEAKHRTARPLHTMQWARPKQKIKILKMKYSFYFIVCVFSITLQAQPFVGTDLPIMLITTTGGQTIGIDYKVVAEMKLINHGYGQPHHISDAATDYNGLISIEIRGNSSSSFPKKSYNFETQLADGSNSDASLIDMPAENDWVLQANYADKTLIRNHLAQTLFRKTGRYGPRTAFCDVVVNGDYQGVYILSERIKRDSQRVDIAKLTPDETTGEDVTGGYIIKIDWWNGTNLGGWSSQFSPWNEQTDKLNYQYHYPEADNISQAQKTYIAAYVDSFEVAMKSADFQNPVTGWRKYAG